MVSELVEKIELLTRKREATTRKPRSNTLPLVKIETEPDVFQPRGSQRLNEYHIEELRKALQRSPTKTLDPVTIIAIGDRNVLVDGHHRIEAYRRERLETAVAIRYFDGSVLDALGAAGRENAKARLGMSKAECSEWAWRLVTMGPGKFTREQIAQASGVSVRTVATMRKRWKGVGKPTPESRPRWSEVLSGRAGQQVDYDEQEVRMEEAANRMAERISKAAGLGLYRDQKVTAMALVKCLGSDAWGTVRYMQDILGVDEFDSDLQDKALEGAGRDF